MKTTTAAVNLAFDDVGQGGPTLLLMPGWCGSRAVFRDLLPLAAQTRRVVSVDWRGHGESGGGDGDFTTDDLVNDAVDLIGRLGTGPVVPVALSHAGWMAIELRRTLGRDRVPGIVLLDWMVLGPPPGFLDALAGLQRPESWEAVRAGLFAMWTDGVASTAVCDYVADMRTYGFDAWSRAAREIASRFAAEAVPVAALDQLEPRCPTLHVYAQPGDDAVLLAQQAYAERHPWFEVHRVDARSHFPMLEVPDDIAGAVEDFVRRLG